MAWQIDQGLASDPYKVGVGAGDNGNNQDDKNNQTGETGSSGHGLLDSLNKLKAEGKGDTVQAKELERYLYGVETKYQSQGKSLYEPGQSPLAPGQTRGPAGMDLTTKEKLEDLAFMEAGDPFDPENKYYKSFQGEQFRDWAFKPKEEGGGGFTKEDDPGLKQAWIYEFGMPSLVAPQGWGTPSKTTVRTDEYGQELGGEYIYSGLGKSLMDQYNQPGFDYQQGKEDYHYDLAAQEERSRMLDPGQGGGGGGGGGGGSGYYGDPRTGNPIDRMANYYTPQANVIQGMINVHQTPTGFGNPHMGGYKRGGIVSLLRLS